MINVRKHSKSMLSVFEIKTKKKEKIIKRKVFIFVKIYFRLYDITFVFYL